MNVLSILSSPWPFWAGGLAIGSVVLLSYFWQQKAIGVTGGFEAACELILPKGKSKKLKSALNSSWKIWFIVGIPLGAFVAHWLAGGNYFLVWQMGQFDSMISSSILMKFLFFFVGGLFIGYGTRMADGCPSGHSIVGISLGSMASLVATVFFMLVAFVTVQIIYYVIF